MGSAVPRQNRYRCECTRRLWFDAAPHGSSHGEARSCQEATFDVRHPSRLTDQDGKTPLTLATYWGLKTIALTFIEQSQAFPLPQKDAVHALVLSARHGDRDLVELLLTKTRYKGLSFHMDVSGRTLIHLAAMENWSDILKRCLDRADDINVNAIDHSGGTALHYAAKLGCTESCNVLLDAGASARLQNRMGRTAPQEAADAGYNDTLLALVRRADQLDVNQRDHLGRNLLHWAATFDCPNVMRILCDIPGAELTRRDNQGKMPIDYAWVCQCPEVGKLLSQALVLRFPDAPRRSYNWDEAYGNAEPPPTMRATPSRPAKLSAQELRQQAQIAEREARWATGCWELAPMMPPRREPVNADVPAAEDSDGVPHRPQDSEGQSPPLAHSSNKRHDRRNPRGAHDEYGSGPRAPRTAPYDPTYAQHGPQYHPPPPGPGYGRADAYYTEKDGRDTPRSRSGHSPDPYGLYRSRHSPSSPPSPDPAHYNAYRYDDTLRPSPYEPQPPDGDSRYRHEKTRQPSPVSRAYDSSNKSQPRGRPFDEEMYRQGRRSR